MPNYIATFNVELNQQLTVSITANNTLDASNAANVIAYEIVSDPEFLVENLSLKCTSIETEAPKYTPLTSAKANSSPTHSSENEYTSLASLYSQRPEPCAPCQGGSNQASGYTRLT
jgi:hypothetical protein